MDEPEEDCALCGLLLASGDVITLKRKGGIATCNQGRIQSNVVGGCQNCWGVRARQREALAEGAAAGVWGRKNRSPRVLECT